MASARTSSSSPPAPDIQPQGRQWIEALDLARQRDLLLQLFDAVERDDRFRALEVGCSLGRGNADELSDVDVGLWIEDEAWDSALADVEPLLRRFGTVVDVAGFDAPWGRWFFAQYADGCQLDVAAQRVSTAQRQPADAVVLFDPDGILRDRHAPEPRDREEEWAFLTWFALGNVPKYLARGSLWEALAALEEARSEFLRLYGAKIGARDPQFGVTSIFDTAGADLPAGFGETYARAEPGDVRRASQALATLVAQVHPPPPLAAWVRAKL